MEPGLVLRAAEIPGRQEAAAAGSPAAAAAGSHPHALLLEPSEVARAAAMEPRARLRFVAGRAALRKFAAELLDVPAGELEVSYACPQCGSGPGLAHGRPGYAWRGRPLPLLLSMARTERWVLLAGLPAPRTGLRLGVDAEDPARLDFAGFDDVALSDGERLSLHALSGQALLRERARLWTRKEAWLKVTGEGLRADPRTVPVLGAAGIADLAPSRTGLPPDVVAAVALTSAPATALSGR